MEQNRWDYKVAVKDIEAVDDRKQLVRTRRWLRNALDAGVPVIAARAALPLLPPPLESEKPCLELLIHA